MRIFFWLTIVLLMALSGCASSGSVTETTKSSVNVIDTTGSEEIIIFHTNDIHSEVEQNGDSIGAAVLKSYLDEFRANNENVLLFDAGDMTTGANADYYMTGVANYLGYNAWTMGNNDNISLTEGMTFPMVSSNLDITGYENCITSYIIERNSLKIGLFGLSAYSRFVEYDENYFEVAKEAVDELKAQGADIIICISHLGTTTGEDSSMNLAENVEGIDLIIDGHSHTLIEAGQWCGNTMIVQAGEYLKYLGVVKIYVDDEVIIHMEASVLSKDDFESYSPDENLDNYIEERR